MTILPKEGGRITCGSGEDMAWTKDLAEGLEDASKEQVDLICI
jgi:hypothetical protein